MGNLYSTIGQPSVLCTFLVTRRIDITTISFHLTAAGTISRKRNSHRNTEYISCDQAFFFLEKHESLRTTKKGRRTAWSQAMSYRATMADFSPEIFVERNAFSFHFLITFVLRSHCTVMRNQMFITNQKLPDSPGVV